jgi:hypothetical protein
LCAEGASSSSSQKLSWQVRSFLGQEVVVERSAGAGAAEEEVGEDCS